MKIELTSTKSRFVAGEYFEVQVRLVNDGPDPVEAPDPFNVENAQPTYAVRGPSHPLGLVTSALKATMPGHKPPPVGTPIATVTIAPGAVVEGEIPLSDWLELGQPGSHEIVAAFDHDGLTVTSAPLALEVDALLAQGVSVGVDEGVPEASAMTTAFVQGAGASRAIYDMVLLEDSPELGEIVVQGLGRRRELTGSADAVHVPWSNRDRTEGLASWRMWLTADADAIALSVEDSPLGPPLSMPLAPGAKFLAPGVADAAESLDVALLVDSGRAVEVARFIGGNAPDAPTGSVVWRTDATTEVYTARISLGSPASGNVRRLVSLEDRDGQLSVSHYWVDGSSKPTASRPLSGGQLLPGAPMAIRVGADGGTRCRFLLGTHGRAWRVYMVSMDFDEHGDLIGDGSIETLVSLDEPMPMAAIEFPMHDRDRTDVAWLLADHDGRIIWGRGPGGALQGRMHVQPAIPLQLRPLAFATYLCVVKPGEVPNLVALGGRDVGA